MHIGTDLAKRGPPRYIGRVDPAEGRSPMNRLSGRTTAGDEPAAAGWRDGDASSGEEFRQLPRRVTIYDDEGAVLTTAAVRLGDGSRLIVLADLDDSSTLMDYFFGRGGTRVSVSDGEADATGCLETRWQGLGRTWMVRLARATQEGSNLSAASPSEVASTTAAGGTAVP